MSSIVCSGIDFAWPDGEVVFEDLDVTIGPGRTGLIGVNGSGKSTLLRLIAGELLPAGGSISVQGELGYLPQDFTMRSESRVEEVLGVAEIRAALVAIEAGDPSPHNFAIVGEQWDIDLRSRTTLDEFGLEHIGIDGSVNELSDGESTLLGLAAQFLRQPDVLLLDEPTNNLDQRARQRVWDALAGWRGVVLIVSHDRELLELTDRIGDLHTGTIRFYGGNLTDYERAVAIEQAAAARSVRAAESHLKRQRRELIEARVKLDRRRRYGQKMWDNKREPKVRMRKRIEDAEIAAGSHRIMHTEKVEQAKNRLHEAEEAVHEIEEIRIDLPGTTVAPGKQVLQLEDVRLRCGPLVTLDVRGPERIAVVGANGAGKTTLINTILGDIQPVSGTVRLNVPSRRLPQRLDVLEDELSVVENVARSAPRASNNRIRAQLARFLLRGSRADQPVRTLSGGERFRATLATLLLAEPSPQLFLLDEPTNNLDLNSVQQLAQALESYAGALMVVSHDRPFLRQFQPTLWFELDDHLTECDPL